MFASGERRERTLKLLRDVDGLSLLFSDLRPENFFASSRPLGAASLELEVRLDATLGLAVDVASEEGFVLILGVETDGLFFIANALTTLTYIARAVPY